MAILDVAREDEITPGGALRVVLGDTPIAIFNVHGELFAVGDTCLIKTTRLPKVM